MELQIKMFISIFKRKLKVARRNEIPKCRLPFEKIRTRNDEESERMIIAHGAPNDAP